MKSSAGFLFTFTTLKGGYFLGGAKFSGKSCLVCHEVEYYCAYNLAFSKALRVQNKAIILWSCHLVVVEPHTFALKMIPHDSGGRLCLSPSHPLNLRVSPTLLRRGGKPKNSMNSIFFFQFKSSTPSVGRPHKFLILFRYGKMTQHFHERHILLIWLEKKAHKFGKRKLKPPSSKSLKFIFILVVNPTHHLESKVEKAAVQG